MGRQIGGSGVAAAPHHAGDPNLTAPVTGAPPPTTIPDLQEVLGAGNSAGSGPIIDLADPTNAQDAATKAYVDAHSGGTQALASVLTHGNTMGGTDIVGGAALGATVRGGTGNGFDGRMTADAHVGTAGGNSGVTGGVGNGAGAGGYGYIIGGNGASGGVAALVQAFGGTAAAHGKVGIRTNNVVGDSGQALVSEGAGGTDIFSGTLSGGVGGEFYAQGGDLSDLVHPGFLFADPPTGNVGGPAGLAGGKGQSTSAGGNGSVAGGTGSAGASSGAFTAYGGTDSGGAQPGKVQVRSNGSTGTNGQRFLADGSGKAGWVDEYATLQVAIDGGGAAIGTGIKGPDLIIPFDCTVTQWTLLADQSTTTTVDIWKDTYANYPPTVADTMIGGGGTKPNTSAAAKGQSAPASWATTACLQGDTLRFNIDANNNAQKLTIALLVKKTGQN